MNLYFQDTVGLTVESAQHSNQQKFQKHIDRLVDIFGKCENPFTEGLLDGIILDSQDVVDSSANFFSTF